MKLATYLNDKRISCGIITDKGIVDIWANSTGNIRPHSIKEILIRGKDCLDQVSTLIDTAGNYIDPQEVKILAPVPRPGKLIALAGNYQKHIIEGGSKLGLSESPHDNTVPRPFLMPSTVVTCTNSKIPWPTYSDQVDYEIELAVMIGSECRELTPDRAKDVIGGYMIANDISARSVTFREDRQQRPWDEFFDWLNGKWSDSFLPLGPYLVTPDEVGDPQNLEMELKVNGQVRQKSNTSQMIFSVYEIISFVSHIMTLEPGDIIATGTPHGVGMATGDFLKPGDIIECSIEKLGTIANTLDSKPAKFYTPLKK